MPRSIKKIKKANKVTPASSKNSANYKRKKLIKEKMYTGPVGAIKNNWDKNKTPYQNIAEMGLVYNVKQAFGAPRRENPHDVEEEETMEFMSLEDALKMGSVSEQSAKLQSGIAPDGTAMLPEKMKKKKKGKKAESVIAQLEKDAETMTAKSKASMRKQRGHLIDRDIQLCIFMLERYREDYEAMSRDHRNLFQYTPTQMRKKIEVFKQSAYYQVLNELETA